MHPVFTSTEILQEFDPQSPFHPHGKGQVEGLKSFMEQSLEKLRLTFQDLQDLSDQPGQLFLLDDTFHMDNFALEMNTNYLSRIDSLQSNPGQTAINVSVSLTTDIKDIKDRIVFTANQFYDLRLISDTSFKLLAPNGVQVATLKSIPKDRAAKLGLAISSIKRSTNVSRTSVKTGKIHEFPSIVIPWMPGKMDQFEEKPQRGCGTFGPGSIVSIKLDGPRKRLWLSNGVSGSGEVQGIPTDDDIFSKMFVIDFSVLRPFVAFSSKFQNVVLMPELPAVIIDVYKKSLSLEARLHDLTTEFSELGGSDSLILFGFSKTFLELDADVSSELKVDVIEEKLKKRFEGYTGISENFKYLNFKLFHFYVKSLDRVEKVHSIFKLCLCPKHFKPIVSADRYHGRCAR